MKLVSSKLVAGTMREVCGREVQRLESVVPSSKLHGESNMVGTSHDLIHGHYIIYTTGRRYNVLQKCNRKKKKEKFHAQTVIESIRRVYAAFDA